MLKFTFKESLILLLSKADLSPKALNFAQKIINERGVTLDWKKFMKMASLSQVAPLLYSNLKGMKNIPEDALDRMKSSFHSVVKENILYFHECERIISELKSNSVSCIVLKGALAAEHIFGNIGLYPTGDIDILVLPSCLNITKKVLLDMGYRQTDEESELDYVRHHYHLPPYVNESFSVEVHWNLTKRYFKTPPEFWWKDVREVESNGEKYMILSPERYIMYSVFRLYSHGFYPLKFLVFVAELINHYGDEIDWDQLIEYSARYKMDRLVIFTVKLTGELLGSKVPPRISEKKVFAYEYLKGKIMSRMFQDNIVHTRNMIIYLLLQNNPVKFSRVALRRLIPGFSEIRMRYGIGQDSKKIYLYYLLNPFLMLIGKKKIINKRDSYK